MYPRKKDKEDARAAWKRLCKTDRAELKQKLPAWLAANTGNPQYLPHFGTFANRKRWRDETSSQVAKAPHVLSPEENARRRALATG